MNYSNSFAKENLPKPLSKEETTEYFKEYHSGNKEARNILIKHNIRLVISIIFKKFNNTPYDINELISIGLIGLMKSVDTFDMEKNDKFTTYAYRCICNEILMFLRKEKKRLLDDSLDRSIGDDSKITLGDTFKDDNIDITNDYLDKETKEELRDIVNNLNGRDKEIISMYFGFNGKVYSQGEIADILNISQSYVSRKISRLVNRISEKLNYQKKRK